MLSVNAGRFTSVQDWLGNTTTFGYDPNANLTTETLPSGSGIVDTSTFDAADRLMAISDVKGGSTTLFAAIYTRDSANQLTSDSSAPSANGSYRYTALNQVCYAGSSGSNACSSPPAGATAYAYDAADNLTRTGSTQQTFNNADQLCWTAASSGACGSPPSGATTYTYDGRGNTTQITPPSGGATNLSYDQANRLTAYGATATYAYNGNGLRVSKTLSGTTSQFLWDQSGSLPQLLKDGATAYVYAPGGTPLEQTNGSSMLWLHHDQLGSTRLLSDAAGSAQASYRYDPFGNLIAATGSASTLLRFAGQNFDSESGWYYFRARYYDPGGGQFLSRDPAVAMTREPYGYVGGDPLNATDPTGVLCWEFWNPAKCTNFDTPLFAKHQADILNAESVLSLGPYAVYRGAYELNATPRMRGLPAWTRTPASGLQRIGLWCDKQLDKIQQFSGYPGTSTPPENDENITVNSLPSYIFPFQDANRDWHQGKLVYGPPVTAPGRGPDGREQYAD